MRELLFIILSILIFTAVIGYSSYSLSPKYGLYEKAEIVDQEGEKYTLYVEYSMVAQWFGSENSTIEVFYIDSRIIHSDGSEVASPTIRKKINQTLIPENQPEIDNSQPI